MSKKNQSKSAKADLVQQIADLDALYDFAGLTRSRRGPKRNVLGTARAQVYTPEELHCPMNAVDHKMGKLPRWLSVPGWEKYTWLWHGFSTRQGGVSTAYAYEGEHGELNLGFTAEDERANVEENRRRLAAAITGSKKTPLRTVRQFHSNLIVLGPGCDTAGAYQPLRADGAITREQGSLLGVLTADCIPVIVADTKKKVVAAFHAGWRGTAKRIVELGVGRMRLEYGSKPSDLIAAIGPGIGACCYAIGDEVRMEFESQFAYAPELFHEVFSSDPVKTRYPMLFLTQRAPGHSPIGPSTHIDLVEANRRQLIDAGVRAKSIHILGGCTQCDRELFFSHRAAQGRAGRMLSVIGINLESSAS